MITENGYVNGSGYRGIGTINGHDHYAEGSCRFFRKDFMLRYDDWIRKFYTEAEITLGLDDPSRILRKGDLTNQECYTYGLDPKDPDLSRTPRIIKEQDGTLSWQYQLAQSSGDWSVWAERYQVTNQWWSSGPQVSFRDYSDGVTIYRRNIPYIADQWLFRLEFSPAE